MCQKCDQCGQPNNGPKDISVFIPEPLNVSLYGQRDCADVIELRILRFGVCPGLYRQAPNIITTSLQKEMRMTTKNSKAAKKAESPTRETAVTQSNCLGPEEINDALSPRIHSQ